MDEATINASLDAFLHGAQDGDTEQARRLHEMLDLMLTEREKDGRQLWLTDHGRHLLAQMHRQLSHCEGGGQHLHETVLEAVQLKPHHGHWQDTCDYLRDLRVAISVANELCIQRSSGGKPSLGKAASAVAERGEFDLEPAQIRKVYDEIAANVVGFRDMTHC
jgi:hypothetical protein